MVIVLGQLVEGRGGQAVQNMNRDVRVPETLLWRLWRCIRDPRIMARALRYAVPHRLAWSRTHPAREIGGSKPLGALFIPLWALHSGNPYLHSDSPHPFKRMLLPSPWVLGQSSVTKRGRVMLI